MKNLMQYIDCIYIRNLMNLDFLSLKNENAIIYDVKNFLVDNVVDGRL